MNMCGTITVPIMVTSARHLRVRTHSSLRGHYFLIGYTLVPRIFRLWAISKTDVCPINHDCLN
jgi:hypothetical protein